MLTYLLTPIPNGFIIVLNRIDLFPFFMLVIGGVETERVISKWWR